MITAITSTPGIGMLLAANLVVMTSGFARTRNHKKIASYTGIVDRTHDRHIGLPATTVTAILSIADEKIVIPGGNVCHPA